jgi:hypothetical protein
MWSELRIGSIFEMHGLESGSKDEEPTWPAVLFQTLVVVQMTRH